MDTKEKIATNPDIKLLVTTLNEKLPSHTLLWNYYEGLHKLKWTAQRLRDVFKSFDVIFQENWCDVVVTSLIERVQFLRYSIEDTKANETLNNLVKDLDLVLDTEEVHEEVAVVGESFIVAGLDEEGMVTVHHNDARMMHAFYESDNPKKMRMAGKVWLDDTSDKYRMTLYYPDRIEYYAHKKQDSLPTDGWAPYVSESTLEGALLNDYGQIPVFHFKRGDRVKSELHNIINIQDRINKLLADMMVTSEFAAMPQRYIISQTEYEGKVPYGPESTIEIPAGDGEGQPTQVGVFPAADMENFIKVLDAAISAIAIISRTPKHYFMSQGGELSGEALIAMEAPLNKKADRFIQRMKPGWRNLGKFLLYLNDGGTGQTEERVDAVFDRVETVQPLTEAMVITQNIQSGIPLVTQLRRLGWSEEELEALQKDQEDQAAKVPTQGENGAAQGLQEPAAGAQGTSSGRKAGSPVDNPPAMQSVEQEMATERQMVAIRDTLLQALEAVNIELVDRLTKSGALDRLRKPSEPTT